MEKKLQQKFQIKFFQLRLKRESLIYQANVQDTSQVSQHWLVFLRGGAHQNWKKMLESSTKKTFWAFRQNRKALRHIFDIQNLLHIKFLLLGDHCLFQNYQQVIGNQIEFVVRFLQLVCSISYPTYHFYLRRLIPSST